MIRKTQLFLGKYMSKKCAYRIVFALYFMITYIPMLLVGYLFDIIPFILIATIIVNQLRSVTFGFHLDNFRCIYLTICLLIIFGYISQNSNTWVLFLISLYCCRDIYIRSPLKLIVKDKDLKWHENKITNLLGIYLGLSLIALYFNLYIIINDILCSIIMVDLTLFIAKD